MRVCLWSEAFTEKVAHVTNDNEDKVAEVSIDIPSDKDNSPHVRGKEDKVWRCSLF